MRPPLPAPLFKSESPNKMLVPGAPRTPACSRVACWGRWLPAPGRSFLCPTITAIHRGPPGDWQTDRSKTPVRSTSSRYGGQFSQASSSATTHGPSPGGSTSTSCGLIAAVPRCFSAVRNRANARLPLPFHSTGQPGLPAQEAVLRLYGGCRGRPARGRNPVAKTANGLRPSAAASSPGKNPQPHHRSTPSDKSRFTRGGELPLGFIAKKSAKSLLSLKSNYTKILAVDYDGIAYAPS